VERINNSQDLAMVQGSGRRTKISYRGGRPCAIFGGQGDTRTSSCSSDSVFIVSVIPPMMSTHSFVCYQCYVILTSELCVKWHT
jgi:hypothetical protein